MNKLSGITKRMVNQPTRLGLTGVGGSASISQWAAVTKYLGLGLLVLAIMATAIMNAVGVGLSRLKQYQSAGATDDANSGISTYATNVSDAASILSFTFTSATGGASDGRNVAITSPDGGGIATGRHTMNVTTNSIAGYTVTVEGSGNSTALSPVDFGGGTTTNNHLINPVAGTLGSPSVLGSNTWGMAIPGHSGYSAESAYTAGLPVASGGTNGGVENAANQATLQTATFGQIPTKTNAEIVLESNQASGPSHDGAAADTQNIYYGANVEPTLQAGEYFTHITYTATVKLPAEPTGLSVQPNTYELGSGDPSTITISATSGLASTYNVWIDINSNGSYDSNEQCTNLNVASGTTLTCNIPTDESITTDTPYTIYVQTQASTPAPIANAFTYTKQTGSTTINSGTVSVDIDDSMIPVIYTGTTSTPGGKWTSVSIADIKADPTKWFDYTGASTNGDGPHWANAVTVKNPENYRESGIDIPRNQIKGYWVYIPRYAYRVQRRDASNSEVSAQNFDIVFETKDTPKKTPAACSGNYLSCSNSTYPNTTSQDDPLNSQTAWATHPAFTWGTEELNGFWIGKFETTGSIKDPTVLPNQYHKANEYIGVFYDIAKSIGQPDPNNTYGNGTATTSNAHNLAILSSHMLKNSEWGAVAYLASSEYGAGITNGQSNVQMNSSSDDSTGSYDGDGKASASITGCGPSSNGSTRTYSCSGNISHQYQSDIGQLASTTNNEYGVYDMSGGAWEYVMGNYAGDDLSQSGGNTTYMKTAVKPPYVDIYNIVGNNDCTWNTSGSGCGGHALFETAGWSGDLSYFVTSSSPWFLRGGDWRNGTNAGVFGSSGDIGSYYYGYGFRVALSAVPQG